jgi:3-oxoacyl-[acyl-carrier protein] reductase
MDLELNGKIALVTAASKGIGLAVSRRLALEGAIVAINGRSQQTLQSAISDVRLPTGKLQAYVADLSSAAATAALVESVIVDHGRLDILILNTPGPPILPYMQTTLEIWSAAYDTLVRPCIQLAHAAAKQMVSQGGGAIVFLTSTWVKQPALGGALSSVMRSALSALSKQMAIELAPQGVRVNQVQPGATSTDRMKAIVGSKAAAHKTSTDEEMKRIIEQIPLGRWADPAEIADAVAFLVSSRSSFITGTALQVDGGAVRSTL